MGFTICALVGRLVDWLVDGLVVDLVVVGADDGVVVAAFVASYWA